MSTIDMTKEDGDEPGVIAGGDIPEIYFDDAIFLDINRCYFCSGSDVTTIKNINNIRSLFYVLCPDCEAKGPLVGSIREAITKWNSAKV